jgi:hypothetical protein
MTSPNICINLRLLKMGQNFHGQSFHYSSGIITYGKIPTKFKENLQLNKKCIHLLAHLYQMCFSIAMLIIH